MEIDFDEFVVLMYRTVQDGSVAGSAIINAVKRNWHGMTVERALHKQAAGKYKCIVFAVNPDSRVCYVDSTILARTLENSVRFKGKKEKYNTFDRRVLLVLFSYLGVSQLCVMCQYVNYAWFVAAQNNYIWHPFYVELMRHLDRRPALIRNMKDSCKEEYKKELFRYEWKHLVRSLPLRSCRFVLFRLVYHANSELRERFVFLHWSPCMASVEEEIVCTFCKGDLLGRIRQIIGKSVVSLRSCEKKDLDLSVVMVRCIRSDVRDLVHDLGRGKGAYVRMSSRLSKNVLSVGEVGDSGDSGERTRSRTPFGLIH